MGSGNSVDVVLSEVPPLRPVFDFTVGNVHMYNRIVNCAAHGKVISRIGCKENGEDQ